jgi:hypothetical protein
MLKVKELIEKLQKYNPDAEVSVVAHCQAYTFSLSFGGGDGCGREDCESVSFYVDKLCTNEKNN